MSTVWNRRFYFNEWVAVDRSVTVTLSETILGHVKLQSQCLLIELKYSLRLRGYVKNVLTKDICTKSCYNTDVNFCLFWLRYRTFLCRR